MGNVLQIFEKTAAHLPDKKAVVDADKSICYRMLRATSRNLASGLLAIGQNRKPVFVISDRRLESIIAFLGVLYSGNFYVPVDKSIPKGRLLTLMDSVRPAAVIGDSGSLGLCADKAAECGTVLLDYDTLAGQKENPEIIDAIVQGILDLDPLYMVFTSGSTGIPKAVVKTHRSMMAFQKEFLSLFRFSENDVLGNQASFDFDVSAKDLYACFFTGGTLCLIPKRCFVVPESLPAFLNEHQVNTLIWSVSAMKFAIHGRCFQKEHPHFIEKVLFSGEALPVSVLNEWISYLPNAQYVNLYAPSEVTGNCLYHVIEGRMGESEKIPLGKPFPNMEVMVLNDCGERIRPGETGEIYVRGSFLASGYYGDYPKTAAAFVQNPLQAFFPDIVYKTGDLARLENGCLYFCSRKDDQVKHMGHRIELGEIESLCHEMQGVTRACAFLDEQRELLVLLVESGTADAKAVLCYLRERLPKYMLPHQIICVEKLAQTAHGKTDKCSIKEQYRKGELGYAR